MLQKFSCPGVMLEPLFLGAKFRGMRLQPTRGGAQRMLYVEHFVIEDELDSVGRNVRAIEAAVHYDLVERRIETPELRAPGPCAPSQARSAQASTEILGVDLREHGREV